MTKKQLNYNEAVAEIEAIISRIENQELDIDELSANVKRVAELLKFCKMKLKNTEDEVQKILKEFDEK
jgi:exodeoxyribonuclease VII small subunit